MKQGLSVTAAAATLLLSSTTAFAQTASDSIGVSMTVEAACTITAAPLDFGTVGIIDANVDATTTLTVQCTEGSTYRVSLDAGAGTAATVEARLMTLGTATVEYSLYSDAGRTSVWGDTAGINTVTNTATGADEPLTVFGRVFAGQNVPEGTYADTVVATITYGTSL